MKKYFTQTAAQSQYDVKLLLLARLRAFHWQPVRQGSGRRSPSGPELRGMGGEVLAFGPAGVDALCGVLPPQQHPPRPSVHDAPLQPVPFRVRAKIVTKTKTLYFRVISSWWNKVVYSFKNMVFFDLCLFVFFISSLILIYKRYYNNKDFLKLIFNGLFVTYQKKVL